MLSESMHSAADTVTEALLLLGVALDLIRANASLLIGQAAPVRIAQEIRTELLAQPEVEAIVELLTMMLGPDEILVAARVDFVDETTGAALERAADRVERRLVERLPAISQVFLGPTPRGPAQPGRVVGDDADHDA
ncbi:hypothetical protein [Streptosporangium sp. NPDC051022]|uniref:hypothetical protein n=1 Tax=Streptosporangium sp. NPDC051022 TaxID=3155752 RepID=UPI003419852A